MPANHRHEQTPATRRSPVVFGRRCLFSLAAWSLAAAPLRAQTDDILNYVDHLNVDFAHYTALQTNTALSYRDIFGDLQGPLTGAQSGTSQLYFFSPKDIHFFNYNTSGPPVWLPYVISIGSDVSLSSGTEVSYTPVGTNIPPLYIGGPPAYTQYVSMTGTRNSLYAYDLARASRAYISILHGDSPLPPYNPYTPGNALLSTGVRSAILTTGEGIIWTVDNSNLEGQLTPLVSAQGSGPGQLNNPSALAIGPDKLLYVLDAGNNRIQKFNATTGAYQGGFALPEGMTVYTQLLQTAENPETHVQEIVYDGEGKPVYNNTGGNVFSSSMAISAEGHIYLGDGAGGGFVFDLNGNLLTTFHPPEEDASWVDGGLIPPNGGLTVQNFGAGSYLQYDGAGNVFTYVEGKGFFMYRDPSYDELDYVNLTIGDRNALTVTSGPGTSVLGSLSFRNDSSGNSGTLHIVDPVTVRTGNIYVNRDELGRGSTGIIEGGTLLTAGDMHKINDGTLILNNVNTYTGRTIVDDGKLIVNGSIAGDAVVTDNATLGGHGVIGGTVTVEDGGTLSPGNSPGLLTIDGDLTLSALSTLLMEFGGTGAGLFDQLTVLGLFNANGTLSLQILDGYTPVYGDSFQLFTEGGVDFGTFTNISTNLGDGLEWDTSHLGDDGKVTVVPEPSTYALLGLGLSALLGRIVLRRRRSHAREE